jgi:hypothetical protein
MMTRRVLRSLLLIGLTLLVACSDAASRPPAPLSRVREHLQSGGIVPIPCDGSGSPKWGGTAVDLLMADALASCSATPDHLSWKPLREGGGSTHDPYLIYVRQLMAEAVAATHAGDPDTDGEIPIW